MSIRYVVLDKRIWQIHAAAVRLLISRINGIIISKTGQVLYAKIDFADFADYRKPDM